MELFLSQHVETFSKFIPKSSNTYFIQRILAQQHLMAVYSASAVEKATEFCFWLNKVAKHGPKK